MFQYRSQFKSQKCCSPEKRIILSYQIRATSRLSALLLLLYQLKPNFANFQFSKNLEFMLIQDLFDLLSFEIRNLVFHSLEISYLMIFIQMQRNTNPQLEILQHVTTARPPVNRDRYGQSVNVPLARLLSKRRLLIAIAIGHL